MFNLIACRFIVALACVCAGLLLSVDAHAGGKRARIEEKIKAADADGDGLLTRAEVQNAFPKYADRFDAIDVNHDGYLSRDEIRAYLAKRKQAPAAAETPPK